MSHAGDFGKEKGDQISTEASFKSSNLSYEIKERPGLVAQACTSALQHDETGGHYQGHGRPGKFVESLSQSKKRMGLAFGRKLVNHEQGPRFNPQYY